MIENSSREVQDERMGWSEATSQSIPGGVWV